MSSGSASGGDQVSGAHSGEVPPVPIPNTAVKLTSADGSRTAGSLESRSVPDFQVKARRRFAGGLFHLQRHPVGTHAIYNLGSGNDLCKACAGTPVHCTAARIDCWLASRRWTPDEEHRGLLFSGTSRPGANRLSALEILDATRFCKDRAQNIRARMLFQDNCPSGIVRSRPTLLSWPRKGCADRAA